jgi:hypothetical protein
MLTARWIQGYPSISSRALFFSRIHSILSSSVLKSAALSASTCVTAFLPPQAHGRYAAFQIAEVAKIPTSNVLVSLGAARRPPSPSSNLVNCQNLVPISAWTSRSSGGCRIRSGEGDPAHDHPPQHNRRSGNACAGPLHRLSELAGDADRYGRSLPADLRGSRTDVQLRSRRPGDH